MKPLRDVTGGDRFQSREEHLEPSESVRSPSRTAYIHRKDTGKKGSNDIQERHFIFRNTPLTDLTRKLQSHV